MAGNELMSADVIVEVRVNSVSENHYTDDDFEEETSFNQQGNDNELWL